MISSLSNLLESRKGKLLNLLNNSADDLPLEKQHQIYGAITELNSIAQLLDSHRSEEIDKERNPGDVFLLKPINSKGVLSDMKQLISDLF